MEKEKMRRDKVKNGLDPFIKWLNLYKKNIGNSKNAAFRIAQNHYALNTNIDKFVRLVKCLQD